MKTLDITFDLETTAITPNAAVMSIGAVAWNRNGTTLPFFTDSNGNMLEEGFYSVHIDLRSMFLDGYDFDSNTQNWWTRQSADAKASVLAYDSPEMPCQCISDAVSEFFSWIDGMREVFDCVDVCLWSQGTDFDVAVLRNICAKNNIPLPIKHTNFRDHRTFFLEGAYLLTTLNGSEFDPKRAYDLVEPYDCKGAPHDPIFDCKRSIYSTWQMMQHLRISPKK